VGNAVCSTQQHGRVRAVEIDPARATSKELRAPTDADVQNGLIEKGAFDAAPRAGSKAPDELPALVEHDPAAVDLLGTCKERVKAQPRERGNGVGRQAIATCLVPWKVVLVDQQDVVAELR
jgi:hypothetical protein